LILHYVALFRVTVQHVIGHNLISIWRRAAHFAFKHAKDTIIKWNKIMTAKEEEYVLEMK
jgi:hypothetical protein